MRFDLVKFWNPLSLENQGLSFFFYLKPLFQPVLTQNIVGTMIKLLMTSKNHQKNRNQSEFKNQPERISVFSRTLKVQKHFYELPSSNRTI
jgi:hypothetical protein